MIRVHMTIKMLANQLTCPRLRFNAAYSKVIGAMKRHDNDDLILLSESSNELRNITTAPAFCQQLPHMISDAGPT